MITKRKIGATMLNLSTTEGYIHKIGTDTYCKSAAVKNEDADLWEWVAEQPKLTKSEYDAKVAELVRQRYTESEEFAIQRKAINAAFSPSVASADSAAMEEYQAYNAYVEECKQRAKDPAEYAEIEPT